MNRQTVIAVLLVLFAIGLGWWFLRGGAEEAPAPAVVDAPAPPPESTEAAAPTLPDLDGSDALARELAVSFGLTDETAAQLLSGDGLIRTFVQVVDAIATGSSPGGRLGPLAPTGPFEVREIGDELFVDPGSYGRYDHAAATIAAVDAEQAIAAYRAVETLCDEAYSDIVGTPSAFRPVLQQALQVLLDVPVVSDSPRLLDAVESYRYADDQLERLSLPQKHLLRMGPANVGRVQARLRQLAQLLG